MSPLVPVACAVLRARKREEHSDWLSPEPTALELPVPLGVIHLPGVAINKPDTEKMQRKIRSEN